jgi:hypothetical protein
VLKMVHADNGSGVRTTDNNPITGVSGRTAEELRLQAIIARNGISRSGVCGTSPAFRGSPLITNAIEMVGVAVLAASAAGCLNVAH